LSRDPNLEALVVWVVAAAVIFAVVLPYLLAFRRRRGVDRARLAEARALGIDRPTAQFPFIDTIHCIGCGACVRACPEGDVLGVVGGTAVVINGVRCVGHGLCAEACPVGAIEIGLGDLRGRSDVPILSPEGETTLPGVFVAGELSGLALIRNAVEQGTGVARTVAARAAARPLPPAEGRHDLVVIGAGPAGIAAALAAREHGLDVLVVDQSQTLGGTLLHFPRRKMVLTRPVALPGGGALEREEYSKEELLELLQRQIGGHRLPIRFDEKLISIRRTGSELEVLTSKATHLSRFAVLALGRRGIPRRLGVPGEESSKVMYQLRDAESYRGQRILVVGGGDSAIEAAVGLAAQRGNQVTLSYRKNGFFRIKKKNQVAIDKALAARRLDVRFESQVQEIADRHVVLDVGGRSEMLDNDYVFVFVGGQPPFDELRRMGIRFGGDPPPKPEDVEPAPPPKRAAALLLSLGLASLLGFASPALSQQSPHGEIAYACSECHDTESWKLVEKGRQFRHEETGYPLSGAHARAACTLCHQTKVFSQVATACQDCHRDAHAGELGQACADCHDTQRWDIRTAFRERHMGTLFPLLGGHARVDCEACHSAAPPRQFTLVPTDCVACHTADYRAATTPAHSGTPVACQTCHNGASETWTRTNFSHPARFPLSGAHASLACADCHKGPASTVSADCYDCHRQDYEGTRDPNHVRAGFPTACAACHTTSSWNDAVFNHFTTGFALEGQHRNVACAECHKTGYAGTPRACYSCHKADYDATSDPRHSTAGFPTTCENCHTASGWGTASFDHNSTGFALTGLHRNVACADCHRNGYAGTPRACYSCHKADYDATNDPKHSSAGFPTTCENCHTTSGWTGASFDHSKTAFPLTGAHRTVACADCHKNGYAGTPRDCYSCHKADYDSTNDPNHAAAGFPTACQNCHSTTSWDGASFDHDALYFPIYSGRHKGTWSSCATCHTAANNYAVFDCLGCHGKSTTDSHHSGISGYSYNSSACYSCHPDGRAED